MLKKLRFYCNALELFIVRGLYWDVAKREAIKVMARKDESYTGIARW